jgi:hypothetical protein
MNAFASIASAYQAAHWFVYGRSFRRAPTVRRRRIDTVP